MNDQIFFMAKLLNQVLTIFMVSNVWSYCFVSYFICNGLMVESADLHWKNCWSVLQILSLLCCHFEPI